MPVARVLRFAPCGRNIGRRGIDRRHGTDGRYAINPRELYIITGASRGIGLALARELAASGASLLLVARRFSEQTPPGAVLVNADLCETSAIDKVKAALGKLIKDSVPASVTLVNNAGTVAPIVPIQRAEAADIERAVLLNLLAPMLLTAAFIRATADLDAPRRVLNISSGAASSPYAGWATYCATKAGLDHFTRCVGLEQQDSANPVTVVALAPGVIDTQMQDAIRSSSAADFPMLGKFVELKHSGQLVPPEDCARRIAGFLGSRELAPGGVYDLRDWAG